MTVWLVAGVVAMNLVLIVFSALSLARAHADAEKDAAQWTQSLALAIEKELTGCMDAVDLALRSVVDEYSRQLAGGGIDAPRLDAFIERLRGRLPIVDAIRLTDASGILAHSTTAPDLWRRVDLSDRPHFVALRAANDDRRVYSVLQRSRANGKLVIVVARRLETAAGRFGGMVFAPITVDGLTSTFARYPLPEGSTITLRDADLGLVVRHPLPNRGAAVGHAEVGPELAARVRTGTNAGTVRAVAPIDGVLRMRSFRRVGDSPYLLVVGRAVDEYLEVWREERERAVIMLLSFGLMSSATSGMVFWYGCRLQSTLALNERLAQTDFLTGIANRRAFVDAIGHELLRARRYASSVSVLMLDIDHFKAVNDVHGHEVGDAVLKGVAACARATLREVDLIARWGGEEFIVLLPDTDELSAADAAERVRASVEAAALASAEQPVRVTVSIGQATLASDTETIDALIQRADHALYRAKNLGRNRVSR